LGSPKGEDIKLRSKSFEGFVEGENQDVFDTYSFASLEVAHDSFGYKKKLSDAEKMQRKKGRKARNKMSKAEKAAMKMQKYNKDQDVIKEEENENETGSDHNSDDDPQGLKKQFRLLMKNTEYISLVMALSALFFVITGIQFWATEYYVNQLGQDEGMVQICFSVTVITAPVGGLIVGGIITTKLGGFEKKKAHLLVLGVSYCALLFSFPVTIFNTFAPSFTCLWFLLFFGGFALPSVTGIMIASVDEKQKTTANSFANLAYNLFGYLPAPTVYGIV
jgi:sugar phosphate permease